MVLQQSLIYLPHKSVTNLKVMQNNISQTNTTNQLYEELKKYRGSIGEIAKRSGASREWVRLVLTGVWPDSKLIGIAAKLLIELKKEERKNKSLTQLALSA